MVEEDLSACMNSYSAYWHQVEPPTFRKLVGKRSTLDTLLNLSGRVQQTSRRTYRRVDGHQNLDPDQVFTNTSLHSLLFISYQFVKRFFGDNFFIIISSWNLHDVSKLPERKFQLDIRSNKKVTAKKAFDKLIWNEQ